MPTQLRLYPAIRPRVAVLIGLLLVTSAVSAAPSPARRKAPVVHSPRRADLNKQTPSSTEDLLAIQSQVLKIVDRIRQSTVAIVLGDTQGSGVIVTEDGIVLTAGHVAVVPGRKVTVVLSDGRRVLGRTLGVAKGSDSGAVQISDKGHYPASKLSDAETFEVGDWCLATGHPGGYQPGRPPVVRLGRIVAKHEALLQSDCPLLGGDSGGPLFDLNGNIIAIHSRIGPRTSLNLHVPASLFIRDWDRLTKVPDTSQASASSQGMLGVNGQDDPEGARVTVVFPGLPAEEAGLRAGDVVVQFAGIRVDNFGTLKKLVQARHPGEIIEMRVLRNHLSRDLRVLLAQRPLE